MNTITAIVIALPCIALVCAGAILILRRLMRREFSRQLQNDLRLSELHLHVTFNDDATGSIYWSCTAPEITSEVVTQWVDQHGMVLALKGVDYRAGKPPKVRAKET